MRQIFSLAVVSAAFFAASSAFATPIVQNGGFESNAAAYTTWPGYNGQAGNPAAIDDWTQAGGGAGINPVNPTSQFDTPFGPGNGLVLDVDHFAFMQGAGTSLSQMITGLTPGVTYTVYYDDATRGGNTGQLQATLQNGTNVTNPSNAVWTHESLTFVANAASGTFTFLNTSPAGDNTVDIDQVSITPEPASLGLLGFGAVGLLARRRRA